MTMIETGLNLLNNGLRVVFGLFYRLLSNIIKGYTMEDLLELLMSEEGEEFWLEEAETLLETGLISYYEYELLLDTLEEEKC